ncbi:MAG: DUF3179 domain-containing protein [Gemmatimonadota bacterium]
MISQRVIGTALALALVLGAAACDGREPGFALGEPAPDGRPQCSIDQSLILNGGPGKDGIPALTNPKLVAAQDNGADYLLSNDRVIGVVVNNQAIAIPINIGWWHEIVNLDIGTRKVAVTHCPLTGSSLAFDRNAVGGGEFGVSGLLFMNNLIMYDRTTQESLWPQMLRGARCGARNGTALTMLPVIEMTWAGWRSLHPETHVVSSQTGHSRNYRLYPYGDYDRPSNGEVLFPIPFRDSRRPPKERVLGIPGAGGAAIAFPFGALRSIGSTAALHVTVSGAPVVVFWDGTRDAAMAYKPALEGRSLTFEARGDQLRDVETGSNWRIDGRAVGGTLAASQLEPVAEAFVAYWFAWVIFHPDTRLWNAP